MENQHPNAITRKEQFSNPFQKKTADHISHGTVAIESERAIAQIQAKVIMARKFPRDSAACYEAAMQACKDLNLAENAFYSYPKGKTMVNGPTIRLAEELARIWGNVDVSINELSRREGETEMLAVAWDMERNVSQSVTFTVKHQLDVGGGQRELKSERDIRDIAANVSGRKLRGRIIALLPKTLVNAAVAECYKTLSQSIGANLDTERRAVVSMLKEFGVTTEAIKSYFDIDNEAKLNSDMVTKLLGIYKTIKAGEANAHEIFEKGMTGEEIKKRSRQKRQTQAPKEQPKQTEQPKPEPKQEQKTEPKPEPKKESAPPKKGTMGWYAIEIKKLDNNAVLKGLKLAELQEMYTNLKEAAYTAEREQQQSPPDREEPPADLFSDESDNWFEE